MQIIHRSVGEPAEGSLTRIHVSTQREFISFSLYSSEGIESTAKYEWDPQGSIRCSPTEVSASTIVLLWRLISLLLGVQLCRGSKDNSINLSHPFLLVDFYMLLLALVAWSTRLII